LLLSSSVYSGCSVLRLTEKEVQAPVIEVP
jgi:hypothetical protein